MSVTLASPGRRREDPSGSDQGQIVNRGKQKDMVPTSARDPKGWEGEEKMDQSTTTADRPMPAVALMVIGGVLAAIGAFLTWFDLGPVGDVKGTDISGGVAVIVFGLLLVVAGILVSVRAAQTGARGWSITGLVAAIFTAAVGLWAAVAPESALTSLGASKVAEDAGISEALAEAALEQAFASGVLNATSSIGTWIVFLGGLLGIVGAILGIAFAGRRRRATSTATAASPPPPAT